MRKDKSTRSAKVFAAGHIIPNPFLLCRVAAVYARRLQKPRAQFAESIDQSLKLISDLPHGQIDVADVTNLPSPQVDQTPDESPKSLIEVAVGI
jgi:ribosomal protein S4